MQAIVMRDQPSGRIPREGRETRFVELRDSRGRLWGRYDPARRLLQFREARGEPVTFDLTHYEDGENLGG